MVMNGRIRKHFEAAIQDDKSWKGFIEDGNCNYIRFNCDYRAIRGSKNQFISEELRNKYGDSIENYWIIRGGLGRVIGVATPMHDLYYKLTSWAAEEVAVHEGVRLTRA